MKYNNPKITIPTVYSNNPDNGVERVTIDGMNQQDIRDAYREMVNTLAEFVYVYEHGEGDSAIVDRNLNPVCIRAREALNLAGHKLSQNKP